MGLNVCEEGDYGEYLKLFWGNKGETSNYFREQGNIPPPLPNSPGKPSEAINFPWRPTLICTRSPVNIQVITFP